MCACTEPVRTGSGAVCVEYGRPKWPTTMLNHTNKQINIPGTEKCFVFYFWHPMLVRPAMKSFFCLKAKNGLGRFAPSALPHYYTANSCLLVQDMRTTLPTQLSHSHAHQKYMIRLFTYVLREIHVWYSDRQLTPKQKRPSSRSPLLKALTG